MSVHSTCSTSRTRLLHPGLPLVLALCRCLLYPKLETTCLQHIWPSKYADLLTMLCLVARRRNHRGVHGWLRACSAFRAHLVNVLSVPVRPCSDLFAWRAASQEACLNPSMHDIHLSRSRQYVRFSASIFRATVPPMVLLDGDVDRHFADVHTSRLRCLIHDCV